MEIIKLNLIPSGVNPTCHCSQYDNGRVIRIELFDGLTPYTLQSGDTATLNVRKPDNTIVTTSLTATQGNKYVDLVTTEQICACVGYNLCDLTITNGSVVIGTLNFIMQVERDVLADGIPSQSVIKDLDERIAEAIGDNYYNKTETDAFLALKADKSELYNVYPTEQENGAIAHFTDGADNIPLKSCEVTIEPDLSGKTECNLVVCNKNLYAPTSASQSAGGITCTNNNDGTYTCSNQATHLQQFSLGAIKLPAGTYVLSGCPIGGSLTTFDLRWTNSYIDTGSGVTITSDGNTTSHVVITIRNGYNCGSGITFKPMICKVDTPNPDYAHFEKKSGTTYTTTFGQTVYGGEGNALTGEFVSEWGKYTITNDTILTNYNTSVEFGSWAMVSQIGVQKIDNTNIMAFCDVATGVSFNQRIETANQRRVYTDQTGQIVIRAAATDNITSLGDLKNLFMGANICYVLATPTSLTLSGVTPKTLSGVNNIYSDTGDVDVTIRADIGLYIDKRLNETRSTPTLSLSKGAPTLSNTQEKNEEPVEEVKDPVEESEEDNEER
jgi:hypothetical protein